MKFSENYKDKLLNASICNKEVSTDNILLQIELTNTCNHKCVFCPNKDSKRKRKIMDKDFAIKIIKECAEWGGGIRKFVFI